WLCSTRSTIFCRSLRVLSSTIANWARFFDVALDESISLSVPVDCARESVGDLNLRLSRECIMAALIFVITVLNAATVSTSYVPEMRKMQSKTAENVRQSAFSTQPNKNRTWYWHLTKTETGIPSAGRIVGLMS